MGKGIRIFLGIVHLVLALNAFGGGAYGMLGAKEVPQEWLNGSPFTSYLIPSLFLFFIVGGSCLLAAIMLFGNSGGARNICFVTSAILLLWIAAQVYMIGYVSWLQPAVFVSGLVIGATTFASRKPT